MSSNKISADIALMALLLFVIIMLVLYCCLMTVKIYNIEQQREFYIRDTVVIDNRTEWASMVDALVMVESEGRTDAVNARTGATGILQLMPIYVADANRIVGEERYSLEDRYSVSKSVEMFQIVQGHYNPNKDIDKAIRMHNPRGGDSYFNKVKNRM